MEWSTNSAILCNAIHSEDILLADGSFHYFRRAFSVPPSTSLRRKQRCACHTLPCARTAGNHAVACQWTDRRRLSLSAAGRLCRAARVSLSPTTSSPVLECLKHFLFNQQVCWPAASGHYPLGWVNIWKSMGMMWIDMLTEIFQGDGSALLGRGAVPQDTHTRTHLSRLLCPGLLFTQQTHSHGGAGHSFGWDISTSSNGIISQAVYYQ